MARGVIWGADPVCSVAVMTAYERVVAAAISGLLAFRRLFHFRIYHS
jgi:hypothetical protein